MVRTFTREVGGVTALGKPRMLMAAAAGCTAFTVAIEFALAAELFCDGDFRYGSEFSFDMSPRSCE